MLRFEYGWHAINTRHVGVDFTIAYEEGLTTIQQTIVMIMINIFLLLDTSGHKIPWNMLDIIKYIMKDGVIFT